MKKHNASLPEKTVLGIHRGIFSIFLTVILGASAALLGLIEGMADFAASSLDYLAGFISDRTGKRKTLTILGYAFSTLAKTIIALQTTLFAAASFRVIGRLGKSFRGAPRDAWISSMAPVRQLQRSKSCSWWPWHLRLWPCCFSSSSSMNPSAKT
jgi:hypothetical protein